MGIRKYDPIYFIINGTMLTLDPEAIGGVDNEFSVTYPMALGAHDFTADDAYDPTEYPDTDSAPLSGRLGDGEDTPYFHVMNRAELSAVTRTVGGRIRLVHGGDDTGNTYPGSNGSPGLLVYLPKAQLLTVQFTLSMGNFNSFERLKFGIARLNNTDSGQPSEHSVVSWTPSSTTAASESLIIYGNTYAATTTLNTFISSNVCTRTYKLDIQGPNVASYASPSSGSTTPSTFLRGRSSPLTGMGDLVLFVGLGTAAAPTSGYYAEIGGLTVSGTRFLI